MKIKRPILYMLFMIIPIVCSGCADMRAKMVVDGMGPFLEKMKMSMNKSDDFELVQTAMPAGASRNHAIRKFFGNLTR
jgi:hypothetical protein